MTKRVKRRRSSIVLGVALAAFVGSTALGANAVAQAEVHRTDFRLSLSIGPETDAWLDGGTVYHDGNKHADTVVELQKMLRDNGATEVWARTNTLDVFPAGPTNYGDYSFNTALRNGRLAKKLGLDFNVELMLARSYGDVTCQTPPDFQDYPEITLPDRWETLAITQMEAALHAYGEAVARRFRDNGVQVDMWDLGNETEYGLAGVSLPPLPGACDDDEGQSGWYQAPDGVDPAIGQMTRGTLWQMPEADRVAWLQEHVWPNQARLMAAVEAGIRLVDDRARFSTHVSGLQLVTPSFATAFFGALEAGGVTIDESGMSYFPSSRVGIQSIPAFKLLVQTLVDEFDRPVFLAESAYPSGVIADDHPFGDWANQVGGYSLTPEGQAAFYHDLAAWGQINGLSGIRHFYPEVIAYWGPELSLFDETATSKPALSAVRDGLKRGDPEAFS